VKSSSTANFTLCKSIVEALLRDIGISYEIGAFSHPGFVKGRCAHIISNENSIGYFGELHPKTITNFILEHPVIAFEFKADMLIENGRE
jgi:phenylalanyl-tRNA synthetase beta chain